MLRVLLEHGQADRGDVRDSWTSLLFEGLSEGHWGLVRMLLDLTKVFLYAARQSSIVATKPSGVCADTVERGLLELAFAQAQKKEHLASSRS